MPKLDRAVQKIFASTAGVNEIEQIGSLRNGSVNYTTDPVVLQALSQYEDGLVAIVSSDKYIPALEDINAIYFLLTRQLAYLFQEGVAEWDDETTYFINSIVKKPGTADLYFSLVDDNLNHALTDTSYWMPYSSRGQIPLGGYVAVGIGITGAATDVEMLANGYAKCNGTTPAAQGVVSPVITATMPNINSGAFIRGNTTAWTSGGASGGADTINIQHDHTASGTTGAGSSHSHGSGSLVAGVVLLVGDTHIWVKTSAYTIDTSGGTIANTFAGNSNNASLNPPQLGAAVEGTTGTESTHTHSASLGTDQALSTTQSILPTYFSAVYYMRVR